MFRRQVPCRRWLALSICLWLGVSVGWRCAWKVRLGAGLGLWAGDQSYRRYLASYYSYQDLVSYSDIDPAVAKGQTYMDSGQAHEKGRCS